MLKQRIITAIILLAVFFAALMAPQPEFFGILTLLFVAIGGWEWSRLNGENGLLAYLQGSVIAFLCAGSMYFNCVSKLPTFVWYMFALFWIIFTPLVLIKGSAFWLSIPKKVRWVAGIILLYMAWAALWSAKLAGNNYLLSILVLVWVADSGAYFGGKRFGKRKLAPSISPGKSWEGAISGLIAVVVMVIIWVMFDRCFMAKNPGAGASIYSILLNAWSWAGLLVCVIFLTVMSVMGDLFESLMKRSVGIKDSSQILPGHGGVLDRTDALLPVLPLAIAMTQLAL